MAPTATMRVLKRLELELNKANAAAVDSQEAITATLYEWPTAHTIFCFLPISEARVSSYGVEQTPH